MASLVLGAPPPNPCFQRLVANNRARPLRWCICTAPSSSVGGVVSRNRYNTLQAVDDSPLKQQLEELRDKLRRVIEEGEEDVATTLISANYLVLRDQLDSGIRGVEQAAVLDVLAQGRLDMADFGGAASLLDELSRVMDEQQLHEAFVDKILEHMGAMYSALGKPANAVETYERCIQIQEDMFGHDSSLLVNALLGCAAANSEAGSLDKSTSLYHRAVTILDETNGPDSQLLILPLYGLGMALLQEGKHIEADVTLSRALVILNKVPGGRTRDRQAAAIMSAVAKAKYIDGENAASAQMYAQALQYLKKCTSCEDDPLLVTVRTELASVLTVMKRLKEAQDLLEDNLHAVQSRVGPSSIELVAHLKNLAVACANRGKLSECESLMRRSLQVVTSNFGPNAPQLSGTLEMLATLLHHMGNDTEAEALARQSLLLSEAEYGKEHPFTAAACNTLAAILFSVGNYSECELLMWRVLRVQEKELGGMDLHALSKTVERLIVIHKKLGKDSNKLIEKLKRIQEALEQEQEQGV